MAQQNRELARANEMADPEEGIGLLRSGARPPTEVIVALVDEHRDEFGVEPIW